MICFVKFQNRKTLIFTGALSEDLQNAIFKAHQDAKSQVKHFSHKFIGKNDYFTAFNVWKFLRKNIRYVKDRPEAQQIFLPSAFLHYKTGDCKSYATFAAAILKSLYDQNLFSGKIGFRLTSYNNPKVPTHIFNIIRFDDGSTIFLDGCFNQFNVEKKPIFAKNVMI